MAILQNPQLGRAQLRRLIVGQWLMVLALSGVTSGLFGLLFERVLVLLLKPVLLENATATASPAVVMGTRHHDGYFAIGGVTPLPPAAGNAAAAAVLRRDVVANVWPTKFYLPVVVIVVIALLAVLMGGVRCWAVLAGAVVLALLCGVLGWMLLNVLRGLTLSSLPLRLAVSRLLRQPWSTLSQLSAFRFPLCCWRCYWCCAAICSTAGSSKCRQKSRTYFLINITAEQVVPLKTFLSEHQVIPESFYPIVRARLTAINEKPTEAIRMDGAEPRA